MSDVVSSVSLGLQFAVCIVVGVDDEFEIRLCMLPKKHLVHVTLGQMSSSSFQDPLGPDICD